jgi:WD40 repeat protein
LNCTCGCTTTTKQLVAQCRHLARYADAGAPDEQLLAVGGRCGAIRLLSVAGGEMVRDIPAHRQRIRSLAFSSDGTYVASSGEDRLIHVAPVAGGQGASLPPRPAKVLSIAFYGPHHLAAAGSDSLIGCGCANTDGDWHIKGTQGRGSRYQGKVLDLKYDTTIGWMWGSGGRGVVETPGRLGCVRRAEVPIVKHEIRSTKHETIKHEIRMT